MARPSISGMIAARKAFQALPEATREALLSATEITAERVQFAAKQRVRRRYGFLAKHIAKSFSKRSGFAKVGVERASETTPQGAVVDPSRYAHLVEFGGVRLQAYPFMIPAAEQEKGPFLDRYKRAGKTIERNVANIGMRNL